METRALFVSLKYYGTPGRSELRVRLYYVVSTVVAINNQYLAIYYIQTRFINKVYLQLHVKSEMFSVLLYTSRDTTGCTGTAVRVT